MQHVFTFNFFLIILLDIFVIGHYAFSIDNKWFLSTLRYLAFINLSILSITIPINLIMLKDLQTFLVQLSILVIAIYVLEK